jgi:DNA-binding NarL/FixJ family response regulator
MSQEIRILLVDDHGLFRESLSRLLQAEPDFRIAATCASATEALAVVGQEPIDVVLLDYDLGEEQGSSFLESAKQKGFEGRVLLVTAGMSDAGTLSALESGAAGIFLKHSPPAHLVEAIHKVASGEMWMDSRALRSLVAGASGKSEEQRTVQPLSTRERAVLKGVFEGLTNKEIAVKLQTSEGSVKAAMQQLFDKTGVRTRSQLVRIALERLSQDWRPEDGEN